MYFEHVYDKTLAQGSYVIGCQQEGKAMVIDPKRDIDTYLKIAEENNLEITHIAETHIHADFLCGSRELAKATGAEIYLSNEGGDEWQYEFDHNALKEGDRIDIGKITFEVLHTPGHTPESISFILTDHAATEKPVMIFTGDFVFVGDVGRPDLLEKAAGYEGTQEEGAKQMFESTKKFRDLPEYVQVWPGHGAGSSCGKALGAVSSSTVGYELIRNWAFEYKNDKASFVKELLEGQPEPPKYFAKMKELNKQPRELVVEIPTQRKLTKEEFLSVYKDEMIIIDTRDKTEFADGHVPKSINIQAKDAFPTWCGWILDYDKPFVLIAEEKNMERITRMLMRIGLEDGIFGYYSEIKDLGISLESQEIIEAAEFEKAIADPNMLIIDVRKEQEYEEYHVEGAKHLFWPNITDHIEDIDADKEIVIHCEGGDRATIAESLLAKEGIKNIKIYSAGMKEWRDLKGID